MSKYPLVDLLLPFSAVANKAGFKTGVLDITPSTENADLLASAALALVQENLHQYPTNTKVAILLLGPGPIWGYLSLTVRLSLSPTVETISFGLPNNKTVLVYPKS